MSQNSQTTANRYAQLLFEVAKAHGAMEIVYEDLQLLKEVFTNVPVLSELFAYTEVSQDEKAELVKLLVEPLHAYTKNFVQVVSDYHHMEDLQLMIQSFENQYLAEKDIVKATAKTAVPMTEVQKEKLAESFARLLKVKQVMIKNVVDTTIIGGMILESNHKVFDGSIKRQLEELKQQLL